jgi:hypothetical protein
MSEGEAFVYSGGGVGVFGEVGVADAAVLPKKWNRLVITVGAAPTSAVSGGGGGGGMSQSAACFLASFK